MRAAGAENMGTRLGQPVELPAMVDGVSEASMLDVWGVVRRRKGLILFGLAVGLGLATLYYYRAVPQYESHVQILVMEKDTSLPTRGVEGNEYDYASGDMLSTHVELFRSPRIIAAAVQKHHLDQLPSFSKPGESAAHRSDPTGVIRANLTVTRGGEGNAESARVVKATFRGPSPDDCATVLNAIVESYQDFLGQTFQEKSSEAVQLIAQAKEELRSDLAKAEAAYQEFREKAPLFWEGDKGINPDQEKLRQIEQSLLEVRLRRTAISSRLDLIKEFLKKGDAGKLAKTDKLALISGDDVPRLNLILNGQLGVSGSGELSSVQPIRSAIVNTEFSKLLSLLLEERKILADYGPDHPEVKKIRSEIETVESYVKSKQTLEPDSLAPDEPIDLLKVEVGMLEHDLQELGNRDTQLSALASETRDSAKLLVDSETRSEMLRADIARKRALFDAIVDRLNELSLIKDYGGYVTEVIAPVNTAAGPNGT